MEIIDGKKIAGGILSGLKSRPTPKKFFAVFFVGNDPASLSFVRQKEKTARELGVDFRVYKYAEDTTNDKLRKEVSKIVLSKKCGGAIVQLPLPAHLNKHYILNVIPREKDVDVLGERALGAFYTERNPILPPPVQVVKKILEVKSVNLQEATVTVVGLGLLVGKPIVTWLAGKVKELYALDSKSDLAILKQADLVITGIGKAGVIRADMLKGGAGIIDFGYDEHGESMKGDFDDLSSSSLSFYTPTPGGTGPILVAELFENFYDLNGF